MCTLLLVLTLKYQCLSRLHQSILELEVRAGKQMHFVVSHSSNSTSCRVYWCQHPGTQELQTRSQNHRRAKAFQLGGYLIQEQFYVVVSPVTSVGFFCAGMILKCSLLFPLPGLLGDAKWCNLDYCGWNIEVSLQIEQFLWNPRRFY